MFETPEKSVEGDFLKSFQATISVNIAMSSLSSRASEEKFLKCICTTLKIPFNTYLMNLTSGVLCNNFRME